LTFIAIPTASPVFVCPAEAERHLDVLVLQQHTCGLFQNHPATEPVMVENLTEYPCLTHVLRLFAQRFRAVQQVITNVLVRNMLLIMSLKEWVGCGDLGPLSEPFTVPFVIFRSGMKLG